VTLTVADYFCGAGGSSIGMHEVPGVQVVMASNHWQLAVDTHNANFPDADHDREDITRIDPRRHPSTDIGWFSPECTNWSVAKGRKVDYDGKPVQLDLFADDDEDPLPDEAAIRSRMLMQDVPRFTEVHRYRAVIVENVTDVLKWSHLDEWLRRMRLLGYAHRTVVLNSAFATAYGPGAPQLRDRVYFVFWRDTYGAPDFAKWTRPRAWCPRCGTDVRAVYVDKRPGVRRTMRYGQQYAYRCPATQCRGAAVAPYALPAATVIDWSVPGELIGDRPKPLKPKTLQRITAGLAAYAAPLLTPAGGTWNTAARPVTTPMRARTTRESEGLLCPPLLVPVEGRDGKSACPVGEPMRAQTARAENALVIPLRNNGVAKPVATSPWLTFAAGGTHQALLYGYDTGKLRPAATTPLPAQTTVQGDALLTPDTHLLNAVDAHDCTFRMLTVDEIRAGMAFTPGYTLLGTAKRAKVRMLGNAVTPPAARDLMACVAEAITGTTFDLAA
jgi:DNA (cytosine-5)-methyltransferase 1